MERTSETIIQALHNAPSSILHICDIKRIVPLPEDCGFTLKEVLDTLGAEGKIEQNGGYVSLEES